MDSYFSGNPMGSRVVYLYSLISLTSTRQIDWQNSFSDDETSYSVIHILLRLLCYKSNDSHFPSFCFLPEF